MPDDQRIKEPTPNGVKLKIIVSIWMIALIIFLFFPKYTHEFYYSKDKKQCVTKLEYEKNRFLNKETYFIADHFDINELPTE